MNYVHDKKTYDQFAETIRSIGLTESQVQAVVSAAKVIMESVKSDNK